MSFFNHVAYLDAGTGSLIVQSIVGAAAGVAVFGRKLITNAVHKLRTLVGKDKKQADTK